MKRLMKGIVFGDISEINRKGIEFVDDLRDAYNPLIYNNILNGRYTINPYGDIFDNDAKKILCNQKGTYYMNALRGTDNEIYHIGNHRLVATTYCIKYNEEHNVVNHMDAEKHNDFYQNLEWCTPKHNQNHAISMGLLKVRGEENSTAILKNDQVHQICKLMELKVKYADILTEVGLEVTDKNLDIMTKIRSKHIWSHISDLYNIPETEERTSQIIYSDVQLHHICQMIVDEKSNREISIYLNVNMNNKKESDKFYKFIMRIRRRQTYTNITSQFNW